jgi:Spy/CpxP family protein refolding chaperone
MKQTLLALAATTMVAASANAQPGGWGPGTMDGCGGAPGWHGMMGPQMGFGVDYWSLNLSDEQRDKTLAIVERSASSKRWGLMGNMREQGLRVHENYASGKLEDEALRKNCQAMSEVHKAMFEASLQARKDIRAVLTPEQREQLGRGCTARASGQADVELQFKEQPPGPRGRRVPGASANADGCGFPKT